MVTLEALEKKFDYFLNYLCFIDMKPNIAMLSEIWLSEAEVVMHKIDGYKEYYKCNENSRSGGVILYIKVLIF